jgi:hypothetical protein
MKHFHRAKWAALAAVLIAIASCAGCATTAARKALEPTVRVAWNILRVEVLEQGVAAGHTGTEQLVEQADAAIAEPTVPTLLAVDWSTIETLARDGVERRVAAGELGDGPDPNDGPADSRRELITQFMRGIRAYTGTEEER